MTLTEVVISVAILTMVFSGILLGYVAASREAEWTGYSSAASALAIQQLEQARTAVYDPAQTPVLNQITNLALLGRVFTASNGVTRGYTWTNLDVPISGTNYTRATNFVTIKPISYYAGTITMMMVQVDTVWPFPSGTTNRLFTNTMVNYYGPDNPQ